jgi:hypothetical protein
MIYGWILAKEASLEKSVYDKRAKTRNKDLGFPS